MGDKERSASPDVRVELLPARHGDCILVEWGARLEATDITRPHRVLVDVGPASAYDDVVAGLSRLGVSEIDLLIVTHVDADHIEGAVILVNDAGLDMHIGEVWHNGAPQLSGYLGAVQGEMLGAVVLGRDIAWNAAFDGEAIHREDGKPLPTVCLPGGLRVTVLGPSRAALVNLRANWQKACKAANIDAGSPEQALAKLHRRRRLLPEQPYLAPGFDRSVPNASSIVLLFEWGSTRLLLSGDSTPAELLAGIRALLQERDLDRFPLSAFKLPHHGSANNMSPAIAEAVPAQTLLLSTDGSLYGHPNAESIQILLEHGNPAAELVCSDDNEIVRSRWAMPRAAYTRRGGVDADGMPSSVYLKPVSG